MEYWYYTDISKYWDTPKWQVIIYQLYAIQINLPNNATMLDTRPTWSIKNEQVVIKLESIGVIAKTTLNRSIVNRHNSINIKDKSLVKDSAVRLNSDSDGEDNYTQGIMHYKNTIHQINEIV